MAQFAGLYLELDTWDEIAACRDFYRDVLGIKVRDELDGESLWFEAGVDTFGFHVGDVPPRETRSAINLVINVADGVSIDVEAERLTAAGIHLYMEPTDMPWGSRVVTFVDPAGHAVWYCQPQ